MKIKPLVRGLATFVPGVNKYREKGTGGTGSARYCYSVWLRHIVMAERNKLNPYPKIIAELGPGDSLGIGLAALISGCDKYLAFDVVDHTNNKKNLQIFDELVELFTNREDIPGNDEFPRVKPDIEEYSFPAQILDEDRLHWALEKSRIEKMRSTLSNHKKNDGYIQYKAPWYDEEILEKDSVDIIFSQAVLEHVDELESTYKSMHLWLKPSGYMSHTIDFKSHGTAHEWNGHWKYSDFIWKIMRGKMAYLINREPYSTHANFMKEQGFKVLCEKKVKLKSNITRDKLDSRYLLISDDDLTTSGVFIQAMKNNRSIVNP